MEEGTVGLIIGGAWMLLITPTALRQYGHRVERLRRDGVKDAMLKPLEGAERKVERGPLLVGIVLAAVWVLVWLIG